MKQIHNFFKENTEYFRHLMDWLQTNEWVEYTCPFTGDSMIGSSDKFEDMSGEISSKFVVNLSKGWIKNNYLGLRKINILSESIEKIKQYYTISEFFEKNQ